MAYLILNNISYEADQVGIQKINSVLLSKSTSTAKEKAYTFCFNWHIRDAFCSSKWWNRRNIRKNKNQPWFSLLGGFSIISEWLKSNLNDLNPFKSTLIVTVIAGNNITEWWNVRNQNIKRKNIKVTEYLRVRIQQPCSTVYRLA